MPILTEITYSQLENRFDSEYYKPEYLNAKNTFYRSKNIKPLGDLVEAFTNGVEVREFVDRGIPYLRVSDTNREFFVNLSEVVFIREYDAEGLEKKISLKVGDVLTNRSGTLGVSHIVTDDIKDCIISSHIIRLTRISSEINPYFLVTFLNCKYGRLQILQNNNGGVVPEINQPSLKSILVPVPPQSFQLKIEKLVKEAFSKRNLADQKYEQAKQLLYKELGIEKLELRQDKTFETKFSELEETMRFDSEYYQPKYENIIELLENSGFEVKRLEEVVNISNKKVDPTREPSKRFKYVELANVDPSTGEIEGYEEVVGHNAPSRARMLIKKGDVLVSSLSGSLDNVALVPEELDSSVASTGFFIINSNSLRSEFLFLLFKTELIKNQLEQKTAGAIMAAVPKTTFGNVLVPLILKPKQEELSNFIKESFKLRKESKSRLDQAKHQVEELIGK